MINWLEDDRVAVIKDSATYPKTSPYHPSERYPEWNGHPVAEEENTVYRSIRKLFLTLGFDAANFNTPEWNPLGELIRSGDRVVLKPNAVLHMNLGKKAGLTDTDSLVTHGSVIRAVLDYSGKALKGRGKIIIGDCPLQNADWDKLVKLMGLHEIQTYFEEYFPGIEICVKDYRLGKADVIRGVVVGRVIDERHLHNYEEVDLGNDSLLVSLMNSVCEFGVIQYPKHRMKKAHTPETNKFLFSKDLLCADVFINLPKMKTHMKAGITCALKNLVGINGHKDYLPHFRFGSPKNGGDEYPNGNWYWDLLWWIIHREWDLERGNVKKFLILISKFLGMFLPWFSRIPRLSVNRFGGGSWHGNDTIWRMVLDLNRAFFYFDRKVRAVTSSPTGKVRYLAILDGVIAGQGEGPLLPTPCSCGILMASANPLAMDAVAAAMMGFDIDKIKKITEGYRIKSLPLAAFHMHEVEILGNLRVKSIDDIYKSREYVKFIPTYGFRGCIEMNEENRSLDNQYIKI